MAERTDDGDGMGDGIGDGRGDGIGIGDGHGDGTRSGERVVVELTCPAPDAELAADALFLAGASAVAEGPVVPFGEGPVVPAAEGPVDPAAEGPVDPVADRDEGAAHDPGRVVLVGDVGLDAVAGLRARHPGWSVVEVDLGDDGRDPWRDAWREHAQVLRAGPFVVRPPWLEPPPRWPSDRSTEVRPAGPAVGPPAGPTVGPPAGPAVGPPAGAPDGWDLVVDPGHAFGSGSHPTTRLCLTAVGELVRGGERVLDVGSGSGILAVGALVAGAAEAVGVDVDPAAGPAGDAVAAANGVAHAYRFAGAELPAGEWDLVLANLLVGIIEDLGAALAGSVAPGGHLVASGVLAPQVDRAVAALAPLEPVDRRTDEGWAALVLRRE